MDRGTKESRQTWAIALLLLSVLLTICLCYTVCLSADQGDKRRVLLRQSDVPLGTPGNPVSIVVQLKGELGNHLGRLAYGYGIKWMLEEDYNTTASIVLRHQETGPSKWARTWNSMAECFPNLRTMNNEQGNTDEFRRRLVEQQQWLGRLHPLHDREKCGNTEHCNRKPLHELVKILHKNEMPPVETDITITLPFLYADTFANLGYINDRFSNKLRDLFEFNQTNPMCCSVTPEPHESVLHVRGFLHEMVRIGKSLGYEELSINKTIHELLPNHSDNIAVIGRFPELTEQYMEAMYNSGFQTRRIVTDNGEQSFCFLLQTRATIIGYVASSFVVWAAHLGNATKARLYSLKSPERIARFGVSGYFFDFNYSNPTLKQRFSFEVYNSEEQDEIDSKSSKA